MLALTKYCYLEEVQNDAQHPYRYPLMKNSQIVSNLRLKQVHTDIREQQTQILNLTPLP